MDSAQIPPRVTIPIPATGRHRPVITAIRPSSPGSWPPKAAVGDRVVVEADVLINGPDLVACDVAYTHEADEGWTSVPMREIGNDRWRAEIPISAVGLYRFVVRGRPDAFETWRRGQGLRLVLFTTRAAVPYLDHAYAAHDILLFGRESAGVPDEVHAAAEVRLKVPMVPAMRSLNVAVAAAMAAGEALRQLKAFPQPQPATPGPLFSTAP